MTEDTRQAMRRTRQVTSGFACSPSGVVHAVKIEHLSGNIIHAVTGCGIKVNTRTWEYLTEREAADHDACERCP